MVETNPYLLAVTIIVSIVHTVFEILAFKNGEWCIEQRYDASVCSSDIQFWQTRKSLEGLSVRSVFFNIFQSFVVLLYVFDNEANTMVRISVCVGIVIELWKVPKVLNLQVKHAIRIANSNPVSLAITERAMVRHHSEVQICLQRILHRYVNIRLRSSRFFYARRSSKTDLVRSIDGLQIPVVDPLSVGDRLCLLLTDVSRTKELVFVLFEYSLRVPFNIR